MFPARYAQLAVIVLALGALSAGAADVPVTAVATGDTTAAVMDTLGKPQGFISQGRHTTFFYDRGYIDFLDGRVVKTALVTAAEAKRLRIEREQAEAEARRAAEAQRQRLTEEGQAELQKRLGDAAFAKLPAADRLAAWREFQARYPYTDISNALLKAAAEAEANQEGQGREQELATLKQRVVEIRARFTQLDQDYARSLANWKRTEITAERASLSNELSAAWLRVGELESEGGASTNAAAKP
jgi:hypothetical protein